MPTATPITRHDIPASVKNLIAVARDVLYLDPFDLYELAANHGTDWKALTATLCEWGYAKRNDRRGTHGVIVKAAELVWAEIL